MRPRRWLRRHLAEPVPGPDPSSFRAFGAGSQLLPPAAVTAPHRIEIGRDVQILGGSWLSVVEETSQQRFDPRLRIGDRTRIGSGFVVACIGSVDIGVDVLMADRVFIGDASHGYKDPRRPIMEQPMSEPRPVRIGDGAFLGVGVIVLPGVSVGQNACVGAGAVVTADVPARSVAVGNPARVIRRWDAGRREWVRC